MQFNMFPNKKFVELFFIGIFLNMIFAMVANLINIYSNIIIYYYCEYFTHFLIFCV